MQISGGGIGCCNGQSILVRSSLNSFISFIFLYSKLSRNLPGGHFVQKYIEEVTESLDSYYRDNVLWDDMKSLDLGQEFDRRQIATMAQFLADSLAENVEKRRGRGLWGCQHRGNCRPLI